MIRKQLKSNFQITNKLADFNSKISIVIFYFSLFFTSQRFISHFKNELSQTDTYTLTENDDKRTQKDTLDTLSRVFKQLARKKSKKSQKQLNIKISKFLKFVNTELLEFLLMRRKIELRNIDRD